MNNLKDIHNLDGSAGIPGMGCFIRISMNNLKDIHNAVSVVSNDGGVVLSGFQ